MKLTQLNRAQFNTQNKLGKLVQVNCVRPAEKLKGRPLFSLFWNITQMNRNITTLKRNITALNRNITALNWCRYFSARRVYHRVMKFCIGFYVTKILGFRPDIFLVVGGIPPPPCTMLFWWDKRDFEKSCIRILKLCVRPYVTKVLRFQKQR